MPPFQEVAFVAQATQALQFAMSLAFAGVFAGMTARLGHPLMRALTWVWLARVGQGLTGLAFWAYRDGSPTVTVLIVAVACACFAITAPFGAAAAECAADTPAGMPTVSWKRWAFGGGIGGGLIYAATWWQGGSLEMVTFLLPRSVQLIAYGTMAVAIARWWRKRPDAHDRLRWLKIGTLGAIGVYGIDALFRWAALTGTQNPSINIGALASAIFGTALFGVTTLLAALELERDHLRTSAERLRRAELAAAEGQRLQSLGQLASGVAHDFNNLLAVVIGSVQLASTESHTLPPTVRDDLDNAHAAAERGRALTKRLLAYAKRQPGTHATFCAAGAVRDLIPMLERMVGRGVCLDVELADVALVSMDISQFEQILLNLVVNARDAMPLGGTLRIRVKPFDATYARHCTRGTIAPGPYVMIAVRDGGVGIPDSSRDSLFEPFYTTKGEQGTGLGLATVATIVHDVHGAIDLKSALEVGTEFEIWLPRTSGGPSAARASHSNN